MARLLKVPEFIEKSGKLSVIERFLPFDIKRVYFIQDVKGVRGGHKHIKTQQALICIKGSCIIRVYENKKFRNYRLNNSSDCLILNPEDWHEMYNFSQEAVLLVLASEYYDVNDYIDTYD